MGDAAHAIVPFYGQGMNSSFEDVAVFDRILDQGYPDWDTVLREYEAARRIDTNAIADLAVDNFHEMKAHTANPLFQEKRRLEIQFETEFPHRYFSKYSLVTFNEGIRYSEAMRKGRAQDKAILNLLDDGVLPEDMPLAKRLEQVEATTQAILDDDALMKNL
jgi:kynurenine 3-monooxygenase